MPSEQDTVEQVNPPESTETDPTKVNGTAEGEPSTASAEPTGTEDKAVDREAYEQLQKELNKKEQELNLRRNEKEKLEREFQERRQKELEEAGKYKELYEEIAAKDEERKQQEAEQAQVREAEELRKSILSEYPKEVQELANDLGVWWDNPDTPEDAKTQLKTKVDKLAERLKTEGPAPEINPNNPAPNREQPVERSKAIDEAARKGDFTDILKQLPSVQEQIKKLTD